MSGAPTAMPFPEPHPEWTRVIFVLLLHHRTAGANWLICFHWHLYTPLPVKVLKDSRSPTRLVRDICPTIIKNQNCSFTTFIDGQAHLYRGYQRPARLHTNDYLEVEWILFLFGRRQFFRLGWVSSLFPCCIPTFQSEGLVAMSP